MNYFFGFDYVLKERIDWSYPPNMIFIDGFALAILVISCFLFRAKSEKGRKITKLSLATFMFVMEVGRIVYSILLHIHRGKPIAEYDFANGISFQMCAMMCWLNILTLILSAFLKKDNRLLNYLYNIIFGCGLFGALCVFFDPDFNLNSTRPFLHFVNFQTYIVHIYLIFIPIYFVINNDFKVQIKNVWIVFVGYCYVGSVAMAMSLITGNNFACSLRLDSIKNNILFPFHMLVILAVMSSVAILVYYVFEFFRKRKVTEQISQNTQNDIVSEDVFNRVKRYNIFCSTFLTTTIVFTLLILVIISYSLGNTEFSLRGLLCFIPLVYMVVLLWLYEDFLLKGVNDYGKYSVKNRIKFIILLILNIPTGLLYLFSFRKNKQI